MTPWFIAGMPSIGLSEFAATRFEIISMFLVGIFASAFVIQGVWNGLRTEFGSLPQLSYRRALAIVFLWGLLFVIVLTMVSGARELMTPGAWIKKGNTYSLASATELPATAVPSDHHTGERRERIARLADHLKQIFAPAGGLPLTRAEAIGEEAPLWQIPHGFGLEYIYFPEVRHDPDPAVWIAEPEYFADGRFLVASGGEIQQLPPGADLPGKTESPTPEAE